MIVSTKPESLKDILSKRLNSPNCGSKRTVLDWQDHAVIIAGKLNIDLKIKDICKRWFKFFKTAHQKNLQGLIDAVYSSISDLPASHNEFYFYKVFWNKVKEKQCQKK